MKRFTLGQRLSLDHRRERWRVHQRRAIAHERNRLRTLEELVRRPGRLVVTASGRYVIEPDNKSITLLEIEILTRRGVLRERDPGLFKGFPQTWSATHD